jgi:hypothetical protein
MSYQPAGGCTDEMMQCALRHRGPEGVADMMVLFRPYIGGVARERIR